jgi:cyclophilin family peptidyl-prolyl cis-trans isomerase/HEAT repeat protein
LVGLAVVGCTAQPQPVPPVDLPVIEVPQLDERALLVLMADRKLYDAFTVDRVRRLGPEPRTELALALGRVGDPQGRSALAELLLDEAVEVRRAAAFGLGLLGEPGATPALLAAAADPDRETGTLAVEALARVGADLAATRQALSRLPAEEAWARLLPALFRFASTDSLPVAREALATHADQLFAWAAYALARNPLPEGASVLRELLADPDPWLRGWAARALGGVGDGGDLERLLPLLADAEPGPIVQALRAGRRLIDDGKAAAPAAWRPRLATLLADRRPAVRLTALEVAGSWLLDEVLGAELARLLAAGDPRERELALLALAGGGDPRAREAVAAAARAPEASVRARAAEAAALVDERGLLERLAADPAPAVREAALAGLLAADPERWLEPALADPDPGVRATALEWLVESPRAEATRIVGAMGGPGGRELVDVTLAGVDALAARAEAAPTERDAIVLVLATLAEAGDYLVRRQAADALERLGLGRPAVGAVEEAYVIDTYRDLVRRTWRDRFVRLETTRGPIDLRLACRSAPRTCWNFVHLVRQGFYDGIALHRVVPDFVVQGGDPRGDGRGGPGYTIRDEATLLRYRRGTVGMALSGPDTGGSQFFITLAPQPHLDGTYTAFGEVVAGDEWLDGIVQGDVLVRAYEIDGAGGNELR